MSHAATDRCLAARPERNDGNATLRQLSATGLVGILHGCLKTNTIYDETTAWFLCNQPLDLEHGMSAALARGFAPELTFRTSET